MHVGPCMSEDPAVKGWSWPNFWANQAPFSPAAAGRLSQQPRARVPSRTGPRRPPPTRQPPPCRSRRARRFRLAREAGTVVLTEKDSNDCKIRVQTPHECQSTAANGKSTSHGRVTTGRPDAALAAHAALHHALQDVKGVRACVRDSGI
jgi:hypothetical protein